MCVAALNIYFFHFFCLMWKWRRLMQKQNAFWGNKIQKKCPASIQTWIIYEPAEYANAIILSKYIKNSYKNNKNLLIVKECDSLNVFFNHQETVSKYNSQEKAFVIKIQFHNLICIKIFENEIPFLKAILYLNTFSIWIYVCIINDLRRPERFEIMKKIIN